MSKNVGRPKKGESVVISLRKETYDKIKDWKNENNDIISITDFIELIINDNIDSYKRENIPLNLVKVKKLKEEIKLRQL